MTAFVSKPTIIRLGWLLTTLLLCLLIPLQISGNTVTIKIKTVVTVKWGQELGQIPMVLIDPIPTGIISPVSLVQKIRQPVKISVNSAGHISLLSEMSISSGKSLAFIDIFANSGNYIERITIHLEGNNSLVWKIKEFIVLQDTSVYTLEFLEAGNISPAMYRIRYTTKGDRQSKLLYQDLLNNHILPQLLVDGNNRVFGVFPQKEKLKIQELTPQGIGSIYAFWGVPGTKILMNNSGILFQTQMQWQTNPPHRNWVGYNPVTQNISNIIGSEKIYGLLGNVIGVDALGQAYLQDGFSISQLLVNGDLGWTKTVNNIVSSRVDDKVFISSYAARDNQVDMSGILNICIFDKNGKYIESQQLKILKFPDIGVGIWKLIHVDDNGNLYVFGGNDSLHAGKLLIYSPTGHLMDNQSPPSNLINIQSSLQTDFLVDSKGYIYLSVLEPEGIRILKMGM